MSFAMEEEMKQGPGMFVFVALFVMLLALTVGLFLSTSEGLQAGPASAVASTPDGSQYEAVVMKDFNGECLKHHNFFAKRRLNETEDMNWILVYKCSGARQVAIVFTGTPPCVGGQPAPQQMSSNTPIAFVECKIDKGMAGKVFPKKYDYIVKGPKNEEDPEIDVPRPRYSLPRLIAGVILALELILASAWFVQFRGFGGAAGRTAGR